jgi:hypothetical protein
VIVNAQPLPFAKFVVHVPQNGKFGSAIFRTSLFGGSHNNVLKRQFPAVFGHFLPDGFAVLIRQTSVCHSGMAA